MEEKYLKNITSLGIISVLLVLTYLILKPILTSLITGIVLAFIFYPIFIKLNKHFHNKNIAAIIISVVLVAVIVIPAWFLTPVLLDQSIEIFRYSQGIDFITPLKEVFPSIFATEEISIEIGRTIHSFVTGLTNSVMNMISNLLLDFPTLLLQLTVALFTFFFVLRDNDDFVNYIQSLLPFSKSIEKKLFKSSRDITYSILYGQVLAGIAQGGLAGISFFLFGINNALFLTILAALAGVFPIIGSSIIWIPVAIYSFIQGDVLAALGVTVFGLVASFAENSLKPMIVSKRTNINAGVILMGMIGGLLFFGLLGFILGPLILAYLLIVLEIFRNQKIPPFIIKKPD